MGTRPLFPWPTDEERLLLRAAVWADERGVAAFHEWRRRVDFERDVDYGSFRLLPLVYDTQRRMGTADGEMVRLKGAYRAAWAANHRLFRQASPAAIALAAAGFELLVIKGAALANGAYGNPALRPMRDVDLAVRPGLLGAAVTALQGHGWRLKYRLHIHDYRFSHALSLIGPGGVEVDVHQRVLQQSTPGPGEDWFWQHTEPILFDGLPLRQPDPTGHLVHAVVHGLVWNPDPTFRWIADAATIVQRRGDAIDWDRLVAYSRREQLTVRLLTGLRFLRDEFDVAIPEHVLGELASVPPSVVERLEGAAQRIAGRSQLGFVGRQGMVMMDYMRRTGPDRVVVGLSDLPDYLCLCFKVHRRREIVPFVARQLFSHLVRRALPPVAP